MTERKKIGILTYVFSSNPGAILQALCLWKALHDQGYDVELINYRSKGCRNLYVYGALPLSKAYPFVSRFDYKKLKVLRQNISFLETSAKVSAPIYSQKALNEKLSTYDTVIVGSDELWSIKKPRPFDPAYYLGTSRKGFKKIAYACSAGQTTTFGEYSDAIAQYLKMFSAIGVRDSNTLRLVKEHGGAAVKTSDPTCLVNAEELNAVPLLEEGVEGYTLSYLYTTIEHNRQLSGAMKSFRYPHVSLRTKLERSAYHFSEVTAYQFLGAIKYSKFVVTDSYHGLIFALLYNKPFAVLCDDKKRNKIEDFVESLELQEHLLTADNLTSDHIEKLANINPLTNSRRSILEGYVGQSKDFLFDALNVKA
jgi:polysaccharide pyruvyl transferase WcaK-like protein